MSKIISTIGTINNAIENNEKLKFAKNNLNNELFQYIRGIKKQNGRNYLYQLFLQL